MERGVPRRRRPRPVVGAGVEALLLRGEELAKGWSWGGAPLTVSVGLAVLGEDGHNAAALIAAAAQTRFAAEASGIGFVDEDADEDGSEPPESGPGLVS